MLARQVKEERAENHAGGYDVSKNYNALEKPFPLP
jgi:hypothetical protein